MPMDLGSVRTDMATCGRLGCGWPHLSLVAWVFGTGLFSEWNAEQRCCFHRCDDESRALLVGSCI